MISIYKLICRNIFNELAIPTYRYSTIDHLYFSCLYFNVTIMLFYHRNNHIGEKDDYIRLVDDGLSLLLQFGFGSYKIFMPLKKC